VPHANSERIRRGWRTDLLRANVLWGVVDQGASSITNFGLSILAGRLIGPAGLGVIAIGFSGYLIMLGFERALLAEPAVIMSSVEDPAHRRAVSRLVISANLLMGVLGSLAFAASGLLIGGRVGHGLILFAPWLVPSLLQDLWRMLLFREGRGRAAALNDGTWFMGMLVLLPLARNIGTDWAIVSWWGLGATCAAVFGFVQLRAKEAASLRESLTWTRTDAWPLGRWFVVEGAFYTVASQFVVFLLAGLLGVQQVGGMRSVQVLFAPLTLLGPAIALPGLPAMTRRLRRSVSAAWKLAITISAALAAVAAAYLVVSVLWGRVFLSFIFGRGFIPYGSLVWPLGIQQTLILFTGGFLLNMKAARRGKALVLCRASVSLATIAFTTALALPFHLEGAAWGMALGSGVGAIAYVLVSRPGAQNIVESRHAVIDP
jgi:O-antigen/teichoic acid export membrane protein